MKDCTEIAERTLKSIFDADSNVFSENMEALDRALIEREGQGECFDSVKMQCSATDGE